MRNSGFWNRIKEKAKRRLAGARGFTLAEMLIVVAIIAVLGGVSFIAVNRYQRAMGQLERDAIAKQIFVAAQNHLSAAKSEKFSSYGTKGTYEGDEGKKVYYYVVNKGSPSAKASEAFERMLPFGAIDETVRTGGSYLIRYQPEAGIVMDVFYCSTAGTPDVFNRELKESDYSTLMDVRFDANRAWRRNFTEDSILGWYGGAETEVKDPLSLTAPTLRLFNEETLYVQVTDSKDNKQYAGKYSLKLIISGNESGAKKAVVLLKSSNSTEALDKSGRLYGEYTYVLDDITKTGQHFSDLESDITGKPFIPGENITVQAVAYSTEEYANIAYSAMRSSNSLFASVSDSVTNDFGERDGVLDTAYIANIRHLENLDKAVSNLDANDPAENKKINLSSAVQTVNLDWKTWGLASSPVTAGKNSTLTNSYTQSYYPVSPDYRLVYDGKNHSISNITASTANAGLFGTISANGSEIKNLELLDFTVTGTSSAGALAGSASNTTVTNVLARNSSKTGAAVDITATNGSAGGLIGTVTGGSVENCAAALIVNGSTNAGGLIGTASGNVTVSRCYSGGHTKNGNYRDWVRDNHPYDVTGATAGGLVGSFAGEKIENSYSTCSVSGAMVGGFAGTAGGSITNCYCTGLVTGTTEGAFAGFLSGAASGCLYYEIVNERTDAQTGFACLKAVGNQDRDGRITPLDNDMSAYEGFVSTESAWDPASPYDVNLRIYYKNKFPLQTVFQLGKDVKTLTSGKTEFVRTHFGDWPAPETFVINN